MAPSVAKDFGPPSARHFLKVSDYTTTPGGRHDGDGSIYTGVEFLEKFLAPAFTKAQAANAVLVVDLDSASAGYPSSFLDEAFAGLARKFGIQVVLDGIEIKSEREPYLVADILEQYIPEADD